jgi:hypothetical protein
MLKQSSSWICTKQDRWLGLCSLAWARLFTALLLKSAHIPRILAGLYLFGAVWLLFCCFGFIIAPDSMTVLNTAFIVPDFIAELLVALWLTCKGANVP